MKKLNTTLLAAVCMFGFACGNSNTESEAATEAEIAIVNEADSMSVELSAASDSVELKVNELQASLDSLNN